ncbi:MAG: aldo/keto reductase [Rhodocyclales bacterium]|nr:aldo/keto reductase [Rhodocyclales bacterium]
MQFSVIENTAVRVSRISFGTASLHHLFSRANRRRLLDTAAASGITHFDTSPYYGYGLAESDLGTFMYGRRDAFTVTTKVGLYPFGGAAQGAFGVWTRKMAGKLYSRLSAPEVDWHVQRASDSLDASLKRLKTDHVDFLFLHEPDIRLLNAGEVLRWVEAEQSKGKVRYWGLAGLPAMLMPWLHIDHPLAQVLQTRDDMVTRSADFVLERGRQLQFTYGYLSSRSTHDPVESAVDVVRKALARNTSGSILVSTRHLKRVKQLAGFGQ